MFVSGPLFLPREKVEVHVGNFIVLARESSCLHCRRIHLFCLQFAYSKTLHFKWSGLVKVALCLGLKGSVLPAEAFLTTKNELEWWTLEGCLGGPVSAYGPVKYLRAQ